MDEACAATITLTGEHPFARWGHIFPGPKGRGKHWLALFLGGLADRVIGDVFESISKHPKDMQKREAEEKARFKAVPAAKP